jgi:hypothetical protein
VVNKHIVSSPYNGAFYSHLIIINKQNAKNQSVIDKATLNQSREKIKNEK